MKTNVKKCIVLVAIIAFVIFAMVDILHDFVTSDPIHYFSKQPSQLLLVAAIAIAGGLGVILFDRLSPKLKRTAKLLMLGAAASGLTVFTSVLLFNWIQLWFSIKSMNTNGFVETPSFAFVVLPLLSPVAISMLFWCWFYYAFRKQVV